MTQRSLWCLFFLPWVAAQAVAQVPLDTSGMKGDINLVILDSFGRRLTNATVEIQKLGVTVSSPMVRVTNLRIAAVEYGRYRVTAKERNYAPASMDVVLQGPYVLATIALIPYPLESSAEEIEATGVFIRPLPTGCDRVRVVPLFASTPSLDANVVKEQFTISNAKPGKYVAVSAGPTGPCRVDELTVPLGSRVVNIQIP